VTVIAALRGGSVSFPLFLHVLGAMLLVGALLAAAAALLPGRGDPLATVRFGLRMLLFGAVPAWVLMRIGGQWTQSREHLPDSFVEDSTWLGIGYSTADIGGGILLLAAIAAAFGLWRRLRDARSIRLGRVVGAVTVLLLVAYLVTVWAMTAKPD
jgi:uncharacterized membrane protein YidH (DUF202 family)